MLVRTGGQCKNKMTNTQNSNNSDLSSYLEEYERLPLAYHKPETVWNGDLPENYLRSMLSLKDLPHIINIVSGTADMVDVAASLYSCEPESVVSIEKDSNFFYEDCDFYARFLVEFKDGTKSDFYAKPAWQRPIIVDALGSVLGDILSSDNETETYRFAACEETGTFLSVGIPGKTFANMERGYIFSDKESFNYGVASELSTALGLDDRHDENIILGDDETIVPIDFSTIFCEEVGLQVDPCYDITLSDCEEEQFEAGKLFGRELIAKNIAINQGLIQELLNYAVHRGANFDYDPHNSIHSYTNSSKAEVLRE
jgi:hypothetical protein